jgi:hypothetical protein
MKERKINLMKKTLLIVPMLLLLAAGCNFRAKAPEPGNVQEEQKQEQSNEQEELESTGTAEFKKTYRTGFEENIFSLNYSLMYPQGTYSVSNEGSNLSKIFIKENKTNLTSTIQVFNNDGAGFASVTEFWNEMKYCTGCKKIQTTGVSLKGATGLQVYESNTDIWYVYAHDPGFVAMKLAKPIDNIKPIMESFELKTALIE